MPGVIPLISQRKVWIVVSTIFNPHQLKIGQRVGEVTKGGTANLGSSKRMAVDRHHGKEGGISCRSNHTKGATKGVTTENNIAEGIGRCQFVKERKYLLLEGVGEVTVSERWIHENCMRWVEDTRFCMGVRNATQRANFFVRLSKKGKQSKLNHLNKQTSPPFASFCRTWLFTGLACCSAVPL